MREKPPQILLTNYMMLELLLTRQRERSIRDGIYANLKFIVFDELHTYRGRQGADVAMLVRRIQSRCVHPVVGIGTSATMVSVGSLASQREQVARVATKLFGRQFKPDQVVNEQLTRSLAFSGTMPTKAALAAAIQAGIHADSSLEQLKNHPVAIWLENTAALEIRDGAFVRRRPLDVAEIVTALACDSGCDELSARTYLTSLLQWISLSNKRLQDSGERYTVLPYKLHQFISQTGSVYTTLDQDENRFITLEPGVFMTDESAKKPIFPNVFSRASGHPFICVTRIGQKLEPREFREREDGEDSDSQDGYLNSAPFTASWTKPCSPPTAGRAKSPSATTSTKSRRSPKTTASATPSAPPPERNSSAASSPSTTNAPPKKKPKPPPPPSPPKNPANSSPTPTTSASKSKANSRSVDDCSCTSRDC